MTQHKPVLTNEEMHALICGNPSTLGLSIARLKDFIRQVEKAVIDKLAEQEPVVYRFLPPGTQQYMYITDDVPKIKEFEPLYAHPPMLTDHIPDVGNMVEQDADKVDAGRYRWLRDPKNDVALVLDKRTGYVPEDEQIPGVGGYHTYEYRAGVELDAAIDAARGQCQGCGAEDKSSALAESRAKKMVVPHGYRLVSLADIDTAIQRASVFDDGGDGADPESARSCIEILKSMISSKAVDSLEPRKEVVHDRHTGRESLYTPPVGESLYSMAQARKESFSLALSVDTKEVQTLLQSYLDNLKDWQLVPIELTNEMRGKFWEADEKYQDGLATMPDAGYKAMLAASPKYEGKINGTD